MIIDAPAVAYIHSLYLSYTPKQIDLTSVIITTAASLCKYHIGQMFGNGKKFGENVKNQFSKI